MRIFRTIVYTVLILSIAAILVVKHNRAKQLAPRDGKSPATIALADARNDHLPAWLLVHSNICQACEEMEKVYKKLEPVFGNRVKFVEVDYDDPAEQALIRGFNIRLVPTSIFVKADGKVLEKKIGAMTAEQTKAVLGKLRGK